MEQQKERLDFFYWGHVRQFIVTYVSLNHVCNGILSLFN